MGAVLTILIISRVTDTGAVKETYAQMLVRARDLGAPAIEADENGDPISDDDRVNAIRAAEIYQKLADYNKSRYAPPLGAGVCYRVIGEFDRARALLLEALRRMPTTVSGDDVLALADIHFNLSRCYMASKDLQRALAEANLAVTLQPRVPDYYWARASAQVELKDFSEARKNLEFALKLEPEHRLSKALLKFLGP